MKIIPLRFISNRNQLFLISLPFALRNFFSRSVNKSGSDCALCHDAFGSVSISSFDQSNGVCNLYGRHHHQIQQICEANAIARGSIDLQHKECSSYAVFVT